MEDQSLNQHTVNPREPALGQTLFSGWVGSLIHTNPPGDIGLSVTHSQQEADLAWGWVTMWALWVHAGEKSKRKKSRRDWGQGRPLRMALVPLRASDRLLSRPRVKVASEHRCAGCGVSRRLGWSEEVQRVAGGEGSNVAASRVQLSLREKMTLRVWGRGWRGLDHSQELQALYLPCEAALAWDLPCWTRGSQVTQCPRDGPGGLPQSQEPRVLCTLPAWFNR